MKEKERERDRDRDRERVVEEIGSMYVRFEGCVCFFVYMCIFRR